SGEVSEPAREKVSEAAAETAASEELAVSGTEAADSEEITLTTSEAEADDSGSTEAETEVDEAEIAAAAEERETSAEELGYVPGEILIIYKEEVAEETVAEVAEDLDGELVETISETEEGSIALVSISDDTTVDTAIEQYLEDPAIEVAEPNYILELMDDEETTLETMSESDSSSSALWHLDYVKASTAWSSLATYVKDNSLSLSAVRVAVIDTGADIGHEDLSISNLSVEVCGSNSSGWSYSSLRGDGYVNGSSTNDGSTHGTHVSGIIAAQSNNSVDIQGTGSGGTTDLANSIIDLVVVDAFDQNDGASTASVIQTMEYAYNTAKCTVMNLSLGTTEYSSSLESECNTLYAAGVTIVCAAGNNGSTAAVYPADYSSTISVINITSSGTKYDGSSYGDEDLSAPGTNIYSTKINGAYGYLTGTSMAAPIVTAAAAMLKYVDASLTPSEIKLILCNTATDLNTSGYNAETGYGAVNIADAVDYVIDFMTNSGTTTTYDISGATVSGISSSYTATGSAITPTPTVTYSGVTLTKGTDYTVSYSNNTAPGTATITITGIGNYTGTKQVTFTIVKASQTLSVSASSTSIYTYATSTITASGTGTITYSSGNTSIATVSSSGVVTGKASGTVTITVKAAGNTYYNSATKTVSITVKSGTTVYNGVDYSAVYNYGYYINKYSDLKAAFDSNETAALQHFINYGMSEGRQASESFDVYSYAYKYADLRNPYKNNLSSYYTHYMKYGKSEGRTATGTTTMQNCVTTYNGVDYSSVYNGTYYISKYSDIKNAYGLDDEAI
ncbi:MAG: S8 family serine peptidase, partial [Clostridiales bacterium]|nr:S8 family serine peptidase [Clostridiales bacterium]